MPTSVVGIGLSVIFHAITHFLRTYCTPWSRWPWTKSHKSSRACLVYTGFTALVAASSFVRSNFLQLYTFPYAYT